MAKAILAKTRKLLSDLNFPASKDDILKKAGESGNPNVKRMLQKLPDGMFGSPAEINDALEE